MAQLPPGAGVRGGGARGRARARRRRRARDDDDEELECVVVVPVVRSWSVSSTTSCRGVAVVAVTCLAVSCRLAPRHRAHPARGRPRRSARPRLGGHAGHAASCGRVPSGLLRAGSRSGPTVRIPGKTEVSRACKKSTKFGGSAVAVERFPVEAGHILMFARSIGDPNPIYADEEYAAGTEVGSHHRPTDVRPGERPVRPGLHPAPEDR